MIFKTAYFNSKAKTIINENEMNESIQTSNQEIINGISVWLSAGSGWTVESVDDQYINIVRYKPLKGSSSRGGGGGGVMPYMCHTERCR